MKQFIHTLTIRSQPSKTQFQIQLPRNAKAITGIMAHLRNTESYAYGSKVIIDNLQAGMLYLHTMGEQGCFFTQHFQMQVFQFNLDLIPPVQTFFFQNGEAYIHGTAASYLSLDVPLRTPLIEGFYENDVPLLFSDSYEVAIYFKLACYD